MKKLLNTLYISTEGTYLNRDGENIRITIDGETKLRIPIHTLDGVVCFGPVMCTPGLLGMCGARNVTVSFLSDYGRFLATVRGPVSGNVLLRREQYRKADDPEFCTLQAKTIVSAKTINCRNLILRVARESTSDTTKSDLKKAAENLSRTLELATRAINLNEVRGLEGISAREYFGVFNHFIKTQKEDFFFTERSRRPPLDRINALLSFVYTLLTHDITSAVETVGLDPAVGYLHRDRPGRPGLALDLMEELRPIWADRFVLSLINRRQLAAKDFKESESGAVKMSDKARKKLLTAYQARKKETIRHPFLEEKINYGLIPFIQAMLFARFIRGEIDAYPPYITR